MSAGIIIFEGQYMADQMRSINAAKKLTEEAIELLKKSSSHRNWKCPETAEINRVLDLISGRLNRLNTGIIRTGNALGRGLVSFTELEQRSETQAKTLSNKLQENYGFTASDKNTGSNITLSTMIIPAIPAGKVTVSILQDWFRKLHESIRNFWSNLSGSGSQTTSTSTSTSTATATSQTPTPAPATTPKTESKPENNSVNNNNNNETPKQTIWNFLCDKIGNAYGAAALMGNLQAESGLKAGNLQNSYERSLGMADDAYTSAVDDGSYDNFVNDGAGYGIAQWTYYSRKQALLDFAKERGTSIGDINTQLEFLWKELSESYTGVLNALKNASSIREASDVVLKQFERPYDQSESACAARAGYAESLYFELYTA